MHHNILQNTSLQVVQPVEGDTIYQRYLDRFGEGICCVRERIPGQMWDTTLAKLESKGINIAQRMESPVCKAAWVDLTDTLGILFEIITGESETPDPNCGAHADCADQYYHSGCT